MTAEEIENCHWWLISCWVPSRPSFSWEFESEGVLPRRGLSRMKESDNKRLMSNYEQVNNNYRQVMDRSNAPPFPEFVQQKYILRKEIIRHRFLSFFKRDVLKTPTTSDITYIHKRNKIVHHGDAGCSIYLLPPIIVNLNYLNDLVICIQTFHFHTTSPLLIWNETLSVVQIITVVLFRYTAIGTFWETAKLSGGVEGEGLCLVLYWYGQGHHAWQRFWKRLGLIDLGIFLLSCPCKIKTICIHLSIHPM